MAELSGGELIARILKQEGVKVVFGIIDGTYFGFYSSLRKNGIQLIGPRHETSALHMAAAYARLTGELGVCMASNGPGVANALPGVAVENVEGNRVLLITSARRVGIMYPDRGGTYQCFDQTGVIRPMSKWSEHVPNFGRITEMTHTALRMSWTGRPGVVHLDVPEDIINTKVKASPSLLSKNKFRQTEPLHPSEDQVERAAKMLLSAGMPLIHAGSGVIHALAFDELARTAELLDAPVTMSWCARGAAVETTRVFPMIDVAMNNKLRNDADVVLTLGSRLGETDWWGKAPYWRHPSKQKMIQVDIEGRWMGANKPIDLGIQADVKVFLQMLNAKIARARVPSRKTAIDRYNAERNRERAKLAENLKDDSSPMYPGHMAAIARKVFPDDTILVADGGNTTIWANFFWDVRKPNTILSTFKMGMLGAGVAQALGACVARPKSKVLCIIGDGAMGFHPQEIETAIRNKLKPIYVVACDRQWGMVKMNQQFALKPIKTLIKKSLGPHETINADLGEIRFDLLAQSMGAHGERVSTPAEFKKALERSLAADKCAVIHVDVNPVKHMWVPGLIYFKDMHKEPKGK
ncbi:MAG TPA: thiamine pyrophosphate-binding protein [Leptospiraceae bacterium]|nr:thiamine pyrophosphate-binding protein [Leptospiraceae bacterium]HMY46018.1 thiamine pyrophosphate-binding protein [Leptospiraceae bacterium]HNJ35216.1 thiamine pyrophosphate-binding protein [Leptospiraceae bacterium]